MVLQVAHGQSQWRHGLSASVLADNILLYFLLLAPLFQFYVFSALPFVLTALQLFTPLSTGKCSLPSLFPVASV